jgi:hypothetical protein
MLRPEQRETRAQILLLELGRLRNCGLLRFCFVSISGEKGGKDALRFIHVDT